jgi:hypothetical protein
MIGGDMTDTTDVVIFRCNAYAFCQGGEQRLLGVIHGSRVCVKMKRKSSYPIVVVGNFFKLHKAQHSPLKQAISDAFFRLSPLLFRRFPHWARVEAREVAW